MDREAHRDHRRTAGPRRGTARRRHGTFRGSRGQSERAGSQDLGYEVEDLGNVPVVQRESQRRSRIRDAKYLPQIAETCTRLAEMVDQALAAGKFPLVLGGDHSIAVGTVVGHVAITFTERGEQLGLIWIDAHADMNTPDSSPSGNVHGMPLACCIGLGPRS